MPRKRWTVACLTGIALLGLAAIPSTAGAESLGTWKVTDGYLDQDVQWQSVSRHDDGCYTSTWRDSGTSDMSYSAIDDQKLTLQDPGARSDFSLVKHGDVEFKGTDEQHSTYDVSNKRDRAVDQCGPPIQKPPDTSGCGTSKIDGIDITFLVLGRHDRVTPFDAISDPFVFDYKCPSDDYYSTVAVDAKWRGSLSEFKRQNKVHLRGHDTDPSSDWVLGPGSDQLDGSQTATIHWGLTFKRVH